MHELADPSAVVVDVPDQGMHLVAYLADGLADRTVERAAIDAGVVVRALSRLYRVRTPRQGLLLGFSGYPRALVVPAATRLARIVAALAARPVRTARYRP